MFALKNLFSTSNLVEPDDLMNAKTALNRLGYYTVPPHRGIDDWTDDDTFNGLKRFQRDNGLKVDGLMRPGGPTETALGRNLMRVSSSGGDSKNGNNGIGITEKVEIFKEQDGNIIADFWNNFQDMKAANFIGGDKYFHCKANCQASQRGYLSDRLAESMGDIREVYGIFKGDSRQDRMEDQVANRFGRDAGYWSADKSCRDLCAPYRPKGFPEKY